MVRKGLLDAPLLCIESVGVTEMSDPFASLSAHSAGGKGYCQPGIFEKPARLLKTVALWHHISISNVCVKRLTEVAQTFLRQSPQQWYTHVWAASSPHDTM